MDSNRYEARVFPIDRFVVPVAPEAGFLRTIAETNTAFDGMEGSLPRHVLKQQGSSPRENVFVTVVEWADEHTIQHAREAVAAKHTHMKLNPQEMFRRLQIKAELGNFVPIQGSLG